MNKVILILLVIGAFMSQALAQDIIVSFTYTITGSVFDPLEAGGNFTDPDFKAALATATSANVDNITIAAADDTLTVDFVVAQEATGDDPLTISNKAAIDDMAANSATITSTIETELSIVSFDLTGPTIDRCKSRDCNSRGTCDSDVGVCECTDTDYWGVNCETLVNCNNGVKDNDTAYCNCDYPEFGERCEGTQDCTCP